MASPRSYLLITTGFAKAYCEHENARQDLMQFLLLALAERVTTFDAATRGTGWGTRNGFSASELWGKTLFLVGFGRIGRIVADVARAFGMEVIAYDPFVTAAAMRTAVASVVEGLRRADAVSLHVPKAETGALIGAAHLALMKPNAVIINTARGDLIDEPALADALDAGAIAGAGLDIFAQEPPSRDPRLLGSPRVILTPHTAALTQECAARMSAVAA